MCRSVGGLEIVKLISGGCGVSAGSTFNGLDVNGGCKWSNL